MRVSNTIRYSEDFQVPVRLKADESALAVFDFEEGEGQLLRDSSGNNHDGEVRGAMWVTATALRRRAAQGLAEFDRRAVPALIEALAHQNADVQLEAASALATIGRDAQPAIPALKLLAQSPDDRLSAAAAQALTQIETHSVLQSILGLFK